jgi:hypothetical protein
MLGASLCIVLSPLVDNVVIFVIFSVLLHVMIAPIVPLLTYMMSNAVDASDQGKNKFKYHQCHLIIASIISFAISKKAITSYFVIGRIMGVSDGLLSANHTFGTLCTGYLYPKDIRLPFLVSSIGYLAGVYIFCRKKEEVLSNKKE